MQRALIRTALAAAAALTAASGARAQALDDLVARVMDEVCFPMANGERGPVLDAVAALGFTPDGEPPIVDGPFTETGFVRAPYELFLWEDDDAIGCALDWPDGDFTALSAAVAAAMAGRPDHEPGAASPDRTAWYGPTGSVWVARFDFSPRVGLGAGFDRRPAPEPVEPPDR